MLPEAVVPVRIAGLVEGVVEGGHKQGEVREAGRDLVEQDGLARELLAPGKGIAAA